MSEPLKMLLVAACALIDVDGTVLICPRPEGKQLAGLWEFPGGKVEPGQCVVDATRATPAPARRLPVTKASYLR